MSCPSMENMLSKFDVFTQNPVKFLEVQTKAKDDIKSLVKTLYDFTQSNEKDEKKKKRNALPELIVEDLDEEQIWQQLELQNNECWDELVWEVANCMSLKNELTFPVEIASNQDQGDLDDSENEDMEESPKKSSKKDATEKSSKQKKPKKSVQNKTKVKSSVVDDKFFKLQEMEQFLLKEEKNDGKNVPVDSDEESIDMFEDVDDGDDDEAEGEKDAMYTDFFDQEEGGEFAPSDDEMGGEESNDMDGEGDEEMAELNDDDFVDDDEQLDSKENRDEPKKKNKEKKVRFEQPSSSEDESETEANEPVEKNEKKSEFELRQERLKKHIEKLEEKTLNDAPWQLKGEIDATKRPQNSLLEEVVDFDLTTRPAPIITEQTTLTLEDIIRQRIKDKAWDDVVRKEKPVNDELSFRKTEILDHAKSKQSLAQVYEAEYLKQKQALSGESVEEKEPEAHTQIRESINKLFAKLDALSHYHYTPRAAQPEVKIVSNTPAISMEEVAPVATSDATLLAPEEIKKKNKGDLMSKEERTQTDKNRERRKKKKMQREKGHTPKVTEHRNTKKAAEVNNDKSLKTSKAFFQQLNDDATSLIKSNKNKMNVNKNKKG